MLVTMLERELFSSVGGNVNQDGYGKQHRGSTKIELLYDATALVLSIPKGL